VLPARPNDILGAAPSALDAPAPPARRARPLLRAGPTLSGARTLFCILLWRDAHGYPIRRESPEKPRTSNGTVLAERAPVVRLGEVLWADCLRALRRAGFVCTAESPTAVMLVNAGRAVLLPRVPALDEIVLLATLRAARLSAEEFAALLHE
jgi:hypothetical protein